MIKQAGYAAFSFFHRTQLSVISHDTKLAVEDFDAIAQLTNLEEINLANSSTTLEGILKLSRCKKLNKVDISGLGFESNPNVSDRIRAAFPNVDFVFSEIGKHSNAKNSGNKSGLHR